MMVKQVHRKINFIPFVPGRKPKDEGDDIDLVVSVNTKFGMMTFGHKCCSNLGMTDKLIRLFYEASTKKIGWQILQRSLEHEKMKGIKLVKLNPTTKTWKVSITPMLREFKGLKESYPGLIVKKWIDQDLLNKGEVYYFVQLKDEGDKEEE